MRPKPILALAPLLIVLVSALPAAAEEPPLDATTRDYDQIHLALRVAPDIRAGTVKGIAALTFAALVDGLETLRLHSVDTDVLSVTDARDRALRFEAKDGILSIRLAGTLEKGGEETVRVVYESRPKRGIYFHYPTDRYPQIPLSFYSQGEGTDNRRWIPCYDEPDDRLTCEIRVVVPSSLTTVSNGRLKASKDLPGDRREDHWVMESRMPAYLISLAAGPYETWAEDHGKIRVEINAFPGRLAEARTAFGRVTEMLDFFGEYLGVPYPYSRYAQTVVWNFVYGGMENTTATTMNMRLLHTKEVQPNFSGDGITAHELVHQWFGDYVTCRTWDDIWINEGFATYLTDLFYEHAEGQDEFRVRRRRQNRGYMEGTPHPEKLGLERNPRGDRPLELFGGKQYSRGSAILHQLRLEIGDQAFRKGIGRFVREHADSPVTSEDLRRSVEREAGRDLKWFFDQWVYGAGYPALEVSYTYDQAEGAVRLVVRQVQEEGGGQGVFRLTVPVRIECAEGSVRKHLDVFRREHEFTFDCPGPPRYVRVDDGTWLLARVKTEQPFKAWEHQLDLEKDPCARMDAIEALEKYGGDGAQLIHRAIGDESHYAVNVLAAKTLGRMTASIEALSGLCVARENPDPRVREAAYEALGGRTRFEAAAEVLSGLKTEAHPYVRAAAVRALGRLHAEGAFEVLKTHLGEKSHREVIRQAALDGLKALGDPRAADLAIPFLEYEWGLGAMSMMRKAALDLVLALAPDERRTREAVIALLDDPYFRMRGWAADACGRFGIRAAIPRLEKMADGEAHRSPKGAARGALEKLVEKKEGGE